MGTKGRQTGLPGGLTRRDAPWRGLARPPFHALSCALLALLGLLCGREAHAQGRVHAGYLTQARLAPLAICAECPNLPDLPDSPDSPDSPEGTPSPVPAPSAPPHSAPPFVPFAGPGAAAPGLLSWWQPPALSASLGRPERDADHSLGVNPWESHLGPKALGPGVRRLTSVMMHTPEAMALRELQALLSLVYIARTRPKSLAMLEWDEAPGEDSVQFHANFRRYRTLRGEAWHANLYMEWERLALLLTALRQVEGPERADGLKLELCDFPLELGPLTALLSPRVQVLNPHSRPFAAAGLDIEAPVYGPFRTLLSLDARSQGPMDRNPFESAHLQARLMLMTQLY